MAVKDSVTTTDGFLGGRLSIIQPKKGYRAGSDAVFLAAACDADAGDTVLELGCGVGTVLCCLTRRVSVQIWGIERDVQIANLARRNLELNGFDGQIVEGDIADMPTEITAQRFDHVLMNPPYFGPGTSSPDAYRDAARHEQTPLSTWIDAGLKRLAPRGTLILIHMADRLTELLALLDDRALCTEIKPLAPRAQRPATRILIRVCRSGQATTILHNPLILHSGPQHGGDGADYTPAAEAILRHGEALKF